MSPGGLNTKEVFMLTLPNPHDSLKKYISEVNKFPLLSPQEEFELAVRYREHKDMEAANKIILSNLRFVVKIAHEYRFYKMDLRDLIQEGNIGLMRMVEKFDPYKGYRFISYAVWWIRAYIQNFIIRNWSLVKIGTTQKQRKLFYKIGRIRKALESEEQNHEEECAGLAEELKVSEEEMIEMKERMSSKDISLDTPFDDKKELTPLEHLQEDSANQEEMIARKEEKEILQSRIRGVLKGLNAKQRYVIENRILSEARLTLEEIGGHLNLSKERVRQIELETLSHLRKELYQAAV
jgi:RNA polymerase sigma-32 factor